MGTFFLVLIKNRLKILDNDYVVVPNSLKDEMDDSTPYAELDTQQGTELLIRQEKQMDIFKRSPSALFSELQFQMADVFDDEIIPSIQVAGATQFYKAYRIGVPEYVLLEGQELKPVPQYRPNDGNNCTRRLAFAKRTCLTTEQLEKRRKAGDLKKLAKMAAKYGVEISSMQTPSAENVMPSVPTNTAKPEVPKRGKGRPKGSKNKKTLACEAEEARLKALGEQPEKRRPGRPKGSLNKSTLERLAKERSTKKTKNRQK